MKRQNLLIPTTAIIAIPMKLMRTMKTRRFITKRQKEVNLLLSLMDETRIQRQEDTCTEDKEDTEFSTSVCQKRLIEGSRALDFRVVSNQDYKKDDK
jgi:hypothetical protein